MKSTLSAVAAALLVAVVVIVALPVVALVLDELAVLDGLGGTVDEWWIAAAVLLLVAASYVVYRLGRARARTRRRGPTARRGA
jgi:hypothetical protein